MSIQPQAQTPNANEIASKSPANRQQIASKSPANRQQIASKSPANRQQIASKSPANRQQIASKSPANRQQIASKSPANRQQIASKSPANRQQKSDAVITNEEQLLACLSLSGDECEQLRILALFEPLLGNCARRAALLLPDEDRAVLRAEACYGFLLLLSQYDPAADVPFAGYIKAILDFHMFNWCRSEQKRIGRGRMGRQDFR